MADEMNSRPSAAATDITELITDLEAGLFERMLSIALSQTAAAVVDHGKKGNVSVKFELENIPGTQQCRVAHVITFSKPTATGKSGEETGGATVLHVSKGGALSLAQPDLLRDSQQQRGLIGD